jgi:hypothetical protein
MISQYLNSFFSDTHIPRQYITRVIVNTFGKDQFQLFVTMSAKYLLRLLLLKVLLLLLWLVLLLLMLLLLMMLLLMLMLVKLMLQLKIVLLLLVLLLLLMMVMLLLVLLHGPDALSHLDARGGHGRQREGHGGEDGCAQLLLLLLHAAGLGDEYGLHAAHHGDGGEAAEAAHLAHGELGVGVVALGGGGRNRLDGLGLVHAGRFRRGRG